MTNGDKIRQMSDEELAAFLFRMTNGCDGKCSYCFFGRPDGMCTPETMEEKLREEADK